MKYLAIITVLVLITALVGVGWLYMTANVVVQATGVIAVEAAAQPALFEELKEQMRLNAVVGTPYVSPTELGSAEDYKLLIYTIRLRNDCTVPADMTELQVTSMAGDVMQLDSATAYAFKQAVAPENQVYQIYSAGSYALSPGQTGDAVAVILTDKDMHSIREVAVTWYMWGIPFSMKTTVR